jgi:pimeloyl-ACP methyl ester carboxylesterase
MGARMRAPLLLVAAIVAGGFGTPAAAQRATPSGPAASAATASSTGLERFTVLSDGHPMAVWARRPPSGVRGVVLLVHGRTWSSRPDFDLHVPGLHRSVMASLAARGFAAYAVDLRGYGGTPRDSTGWLTPRRSAADVVNVLDWVAQQYPSLAKPALIGWSRGAAVAMLVAVEAPSRLSALVLFGFSYDPDLAFGDVDTPARPLRAKNTRESAASDFISPKITPPEVIREFVAAALESDPITADLKSDHEFSAIAPAKIGTPTLILFGERDPGVLQAEAGKLLARLGTADKQLVELPGADHAAQLEDTHDAWVAAVVNFLTRPPAARR